MAVAIEGYAPVPGGELYYREVGRGRPVVVLHGGPDFDHAYLLPEMDRLAESFRLVYYDQRGRGRSGSGVREEDVSFESEIEDLEALRQFLGLESAAILGHSWGCVLALAYAIRYPQAASHLILLNTAPASHAEYRLLRQELSWKRTAGDVEGMSAIKSTARYQAGDLEVDAEYYRIHFRPTVRDPDELESVIRTLRANFTEEGVLRARAVEERLMEDTWLDPAFDLFPQLTELPIPTLVIHGDYDFIPVECARRIIEAIPGARLTVLPDCGHFSYLEHPDEVASEMIRHFDSQA